jgi:peptidoglycan hydrolase-like protein with peptidoglycan-binding domain
LSISRIGRRPAVALTAAGAALVVAAGAVFAATATTGHGAPAGAASAWARAARRVTSRAVAPLRVISVTPEPGSRSADGAAQVRVMFSAPIAAGSPMPQLYPAIPGSWARQGDAAVFTPVTGFGAGASVTVMVPAGGSGVRGRDGAELAAQTSASYRYTTGSYSTLRLQQILAQLGYLPLSWVALPAGHGAAVPAGEPMTELAAAYEPPQGTFVWQPGYPQSLTGLWQAGSGNVIDTGAIMAFEADNGLPVDGTAGPAFWAALLRAAAEGRGSTHGYTYAIASRGSPETLTIWHDGRQVFSSPANTGIPVAPTADGTFPVYERLRYQVMTGNNPDGSYYADPVEYVAYFNGGDAVHYFPRYSYGWPQSLGCVELPLNAAAVAWPYLSYGSLVTVSP